MYLTVNQVIKHITNHGNRIVETIIEPKLLFDYKYSNAKGKIFSLGEVDCIVEKVEYFELSEPPFGQIIYYIPYSVELLKNKIDERI